METKRRAIANVGATLSLGCGWAMFSAVSGCLKFEHLGVTPLVG